MASASTADTWRETGARAERRSGPRAPRPEEHVSRIARPPVPPPAPRMGSAPVPPFPEHLARAGRGRSDDDRPAPRAARPEVHRGEAAQASRPGRPAGARPAAARPGPQDRRPSGRSADRPDRHAPDDSERGRRPEPRATAEPESGSRLRGWAAVLAMLLVTLAGATADAFLGAGLGLLTLVTLTGAAAVATLLVRRRDLVTTVVAPPMVYVVAAGVATALFGTLNLAAVATLLIRGFPAMAVATGVGLVVALIRWAARR